MWINSLDQWFSHCVKPDFLNFMLSLRKGLYKIQKCFSMKPPMAFQAEMTLNILNLLPIYITPFKMTNPLVSLLLYLTRRTVGRTRFHCCRFVMIKRQRVLVVAHRTNKWTLGWWGFPFMTVRYFQRTLPFVAFMHKIVALQVVRPVCESRSVWRGGKGCPLAWMSKTVRKCFRFPSAEFRVPGVPTWVSVLQMCLSFFSWDHSDVKLACTGIDSPSKLCRSRNCTSPSVCLDVFQRNFDDKTLFT